MVANRYTKVLVAVVALTLVASAVAASGAVALQEDDDSETATDDQTDAEVTQSSAYLRVAHASPDAPDVNVVLDNETIAENVSVGTVGQYMVVESGEHNVTITVAGQPENVLFEGNLTLEPRTVTTAVATGDFSVSGTTEFGMANFTDNAFEPEDEEAALRVVHLSPDTDAVDVVVVEGPTEEAADTPAGEDGEAENETETATAEDGDAENETETATAEDGDAENETETATAENATETATPEDGAVANETETATPEDGAVANETETATPGDDEEMEVGTPVEANETQETVLAENVDFQNASEYMNVPEGDYTLEIREASPDNDGAVIATVDVSVEGGQAYSAMAIGYSDTANSPAGQAFSVETVKDASMTVNLPDREIETNETETPEDEETETPEDEETETPEDEETETPEDEETETPEDEETETPEDEETETPEDGEA